MVRSKKLMWHNIMRSIKNQIVLVIYILEIINNIFEYIYFLGFFEKWKRNNN